jgi:hypothetical protein
MDIAIPIGASVAAVAMDNGQINYLVMQKKIYYSGPANSRSFVPVLNLNIDPRLILNILYDEPVKMAGWKCRNDNDNFVSECSRHQDPLKITWAHRKAKEKNVSIVHHDFDVEMEFHKFNETGNVKNEIFTIAQPNGFRKIN